VTVSAVSAAAAAVAATEVLVTASESEAVAAAAVAPVTAAPTEPQASDGGDEYDGDDGYYEDDYVDDADGEEDDVDSDFDVPEGAVPPQGEALIQGYIELAKLYGHSGLDSAPPPDMQIEWDRRWGSVHADGTFWHADDGPDGGPDNIVGRIQLAHVTRCAFTNGRSEEICLSQDDKCHLLRITDECQSTKTIDDWHKVLARARDVAATAGA
jgi:hypothetical protein